jgi:hypothetical protein
VILSYCLCEQDPNEGYEDILEFDHEGKNLTLKYCPECKGYWLFRYSDGYSGGHTCVLILNGEIAKKIEPFIAMKALEK